MKRPFAFGQPLRILVDSAGIIACPLTRDSQGYESQFATNHPGHFQLGVRPLACRSIVLGSNEHQRGCYAVWSSRSADVRTFTDSNQ